MHGSGNQGRFGRQKGGLKVVLVWVQLLPMGMLYQWEWAYLCVLASLAIIRPTTLLQLSPPWKYFANSIYEYSLVINNCQHLLTYNLFNFLECQVIEFVDVVLSLLGNSVHKWLHFRLLHFAFLIINWVFRFVLWFLQGWYYSSVRPFSSWVIYEWSVNAQICRKLIYFLIKFQKYIK